MPTLTLKQKALSNLWAFVAIWKVTVSSSYSIRGSKWPLKFHDHIRRGKASKLWESSASTKLGDANSNDINVPDMEYVKSQLTLYLKNRDQLNADRLAQEQVGKVIGGTRGNALLDFVSGAPNKAFLQEKVPDVFDYDELVKYGFSHLVEPIMNSGGRRMMYKLMNMQEPDIPEHLARPKVTKKISMQGSKDSKYSGLKMTQVLNDEEIGRMLSSSSQKKPLFDEISDVPLTVGPNHNRILPEWTPAMLDEEGRRAGRAMSWARDQAKKCVSDPFESFHLEANLQLYSILSSLVVSFVYGRSTATLLKLFDSNADVKSFLESFQPVAIAIIAASLLSSVINGFILAPEKNRSMVIWFIKGFVGGKKVDNLEILLLILATLTGFSCFRSLERTPCNSSIEKS